MLLSKGIPITYIFNKIRREFLFVVFYIITFKLIANYVDLSFLSIPFAMPGVLGTAISIILAFRVNQAYSRWWEARIVWGAIVNDSRSYVRQLLTLLQGGEGESSHLRDFRQKVAFRQIAWCYVLGRSLRKLAPLSDLQHLLKSEELRTYEDQDNIPNAILLQHGRDIQEAYRRGWITDIQQAQIDSTLSRLCDSMGKCERIKGTVFPMMYSILLHSFLYLFIFLLPLGLIDYSPLITMPIIIAIAAVFFLIEQTSFYLQNPFENRENDTPVTAIARTIEINIKQMLAEENIPEKMEAETFFLM